MMGPGIQGPLVHSRADTSELGRRQVAFGTPAPLQADPAKEERARERAKCRG
jgi:hypothetical protein